MKYSTHDYAKALAEVVADPKANKAAAAKNFLALVRRNGDEPRLKKILDEAGRFLRAGGRAKGSEVAGAGRDVLIESARPLGKSQDSMVKKFLQHGDVVTYATNSDLVAGVKITVNDEMQFDGTMKAKLDTLMRQFI